MIRTVVLAAVAGAALLSVSACATSTAPPGSVPSAATQPVPLSSAWYNTGSATRPTVAAAQVAPGAYRPVTASATGIPWAVPSGTLAASPSATVAVSAAPVCAPPLGPATSIPVTATAGTGTITVHWPDLSDPSVLLYRLAAIPSYGPPPSWVTVAATRTCKTLTVTITGLVKNAHYEIWLDAVQTDVTYGVSNITRETMIGRSLAVTVR